MKKVNVMVITLAVFLTTFMTAIEGTIVSTAMPTIVSSLNGLKIMNWVVAIFVFMTTVSTPIFGKLADSVGRKPIFLFGITLFIVGSALCGLAHNMVQLILFRVIQGLGSGAVQPVAMTILADMYEPERRAKMLGLNSGFWLVASIIAPLLGGFVIQKLSWHWVFYINVPIGLLALILVIIFMNESRAKTKVKLDLKGTFWLMILLLSLMFLLQQLGTLKPVYLLVLFTVVLVCAILFYREEKRAEDPIMPITMLKKRQFLAMNMTTLLIGGVVAGFEFYLPTWMQGVKGVSATVAGFAVTPCSLLWVVGSFLVGRLLKRWGVRKTFYGVLTIILIVDCVLLILPITTPVWTYYVIAGINGVAFGVVIPASQVQAQVLVEPSNVGVATSFNTLMRFLGQTMMMSIFGITFNTVVAKQLAKNPQLNQAMMNKIVSSAKAKELAANLVPQLRQVLFSALKGVFVASLVAIVLALLFNSIYQSKNKQQA
ncbi:MDR family MFS transporter [Lactobacillus panisapium]|uniref:MFS transporter n=1 Tax=Lactobacillus panisapium TaxID=2012495 RepID=A0ABX8WCB8_9LACO|nr:MDR family MFS transporter [Lactobacillus panisapium]QYN53193.1 MFS transporter [Lactobacillus panisapium]